MTGSDDELEVLRSIDTKLSALLAIAIDNYVRVHKIAGARARPIEAMLHRAGLSTGEVAELLGKGQRAVQIAVKETPRKRAPEKTTKKRTRKTARKKSR